MFIVAFNVVVHECLEGSSTKPRVHVCPNLGETIPVPAQACLYTHPKDSAYNYGLEH